MRSLRTPLGLPVVPRFAAALALALLLLPLGSSAGVVIRVPLDATTIAEGLGIATPGDTVRVDCETYYESGLTLPDGVVLESAGWDSGCVVIDGGRSGTIMNCVSTTGAAVQGITFINGSGVNGGAVFCSNASVTFDYCHFSGNHAANAGGAMSWSGGAPDIVGCTFNGNTSDNVGAGLAIHETGGTVEGCRFGGNEAPYGAGVHATVPGTTTQFTECEFQWNVATNTSGLGGGGVYAGYEAAPMFFQCRFHQNEAYNGGAVYHQSSAAPYYMSCEFEDNTAQYDGGAVFGTADDATFDGCEFIFNEAPSGSGGAMCLNGSAVSAEYCIFYTNTGRDGGAVVCYDAAQLVLDNCTLVENITSAGAGCVEAWDSSILTVGETIVAFNRGGGTIDCDGSCTVTLTCCDVSDNEGGDWIGCIAGQDVLNGNLNSNPLFCDLPVYSLYLCTDSPCLSANNDCGTLIGALGDGGCGACGSPVKSASWGSIKGTYR
ncbi:MAG: hypothetical protein ABIE42_10155 [Candidatus Eisenbacteria bacterium]